MFAANYQLEKIQFLLESRKTLEFSALEDVAMLNELKTVSDKLDSIPEVQV